MNTMNQGSPPITGSWTHSFEEDEGDILVYRPTNSFAFPPSRRGREVLLFASGEMTMLTPGPDDRPRDSGGRWGALGMNRFGFGGTQNSPAQVIEVIESTPDILKIRQR
jgi:hypothetical protein